MNEDTVKGNWKQFKGKMIEQWGKLTNDDFDVIAGKRDQFLGKLQERHGLARDAAETQLKEWQARHPNSGLTTESESDFGHSLFFRSIQHDKLDP